jgi:hypothetical protein
LTVGDEAAVAEVAADSADRGHQEALRRWFDRLRHHDGFAAKRDLEEVAAAGALLVE